MQGEKGIRQLKRELIRLTSFVEDFGTEEESESEDVDFANDVLDTLSWILGEISNKDFRDAPYLNMPNLEAIVKNIEKRIGEKPQDYQ